MLRDRGVKPILFHPFEKDAHSLPRRHSTEFIYSSGSHCIAKHLKFVPIRCPGEETMRSGMLLAVLSLMVTLRSCQSSCEEQESQRGELEDSPSFANILKRYSDIDYDSFVGLMGRRNAGTDGIQPPHKRDMHDVFVGLMGRRSSQTGNARPWRKAYPERRGGTFYTKCKLRFRRGV